MKSFCVQLTTAFLPKCSPTICILIHSASLLLRIYLKFTYLEFPVTIFFPPFYEDQGNLCPVPASGTTFFLHNYLKVTDSDFPISPESFFYTSGCESLGQILGSI